MYYAVNYARAIFVLMARTVRHSGFKGQARVILPTITSCYECSLDMLTPQTAFPICTIANTPRLPEHCIEWASILEWPKVFKGEWAPSGLGGGPQPD